MNVLKILKSIRYHCVLLQFDEKQYLLCHFHRVGVWKPDRADPGRINITVCICDAQKWPSLPCRNQCCQKRAFVCKTRWPFMLDKNKSLWSLSNHCSEKKKVTRCYGQYDSLFIIVLEQLTKTRFLWVLVFFICGFPLTDTVVIRFIVSRYSSHPCCFYWEDQHSFFPHQQTRS